HNSDRPGFVNGLRSAALAVFMAMVDVRVVRMPVPKRFMPAPASSLNLVIALLLAARLPSIGAKGATVAVGFCGVGLSLELFVLALRHLRSARTGAYFSVAPFLGAIIAIALLWAHGIAADCYGRDNRCKQPPRSLPLREGARCARFREGKCARAETRQHYFYSPPPQKGRPESRPLPSPLGTEERRKGVCGFRRSKPGRRAYNAPVVSQ
ncbi:MAG: hypothetical protein WCA53_10425, partial [Caballeronia sp.]